MKWPPFALAILLGSLTVASASDPQNDPDNKEFRKRMSDEIESLSAKLRANPLDDALWFERGNRWFWSRHFRNAIADFSRAIWINPSKSEYFHERGSVYSLDERPYLAILDFTSAIERDPGNLEALDYRAQEWASIGRFREAIDDYSNAIRVVRQVPELYNNRARVIMVKGDLDAATADYNRALALDRNMAEPHAGLARIAMRKGDGDRALAGMKTAIEVDPDDPKLWIQLAVVRFLHRKPGVRDALDKAIELGSPISLATREAIVLGILFARVDRRPDDERESLKKLARFHETLKAEATSPGLLQLSNQTAAILGYLRDGDAPDALLSIGRGIPEITEGRFIVALSEFSRGRTPSALAHLRWVTEHGNRFTDEYDFALYLLKNPTWPEPPPAPARTR